MALGKAGRDAFFSLSFSVLVQDVKSSAFCFV